MSQNFFHSIKAMLAAPYALGTIISLDFSDGRKEKAVSFSIADFKDLTAGFQSIVTAGSFIVGGFWVYRKYLFQEERYPHIESSADIVLLGEQDEYWIVELAGILENKGKVQHRIKKFDFDVNALFENDRIEVSEEFGGQALFPHEVMRGSLLPRNYEFFFIDPGIKTRYSYVARIPKRCTFALFHCWFEYPDRKNFDHTAEKTVNFRTMARALENGTAQ